VDRPDPVNVYGRSKLAGERFVRDLVPEHLIVRTAWIVGGGSDFVSRSLPRLAAGEPVDAVADRVGSPTPVGPLAERLLPLLLTGRYGTYHLAGPEALTWFEALSRCAAAAGLRGEVRPVPAADLRLAAPRPRRSDLVSVLLDATGIEPMPPVDVAIEALIEELVHQ
jgi:dTDP-4-dehydrorhamnose reductase